MNGHAGRFLAIYVTGFVALLALTRVAAPFGAAHQPQARRVDDYYRPIEERMNQVRAAREMLLSPDPQTRLAGAVRLGTFGPNAASATLLLAETLKDPNRSVRAAAARALGNIGHIAYPAVPGLIRSLHDHDATVRLRAIEALRKIRTTGRIDAVR